MAKVYLKDVRELVEKAGKIRMDLALSTRRIGNVHIGGPLSATDIAVALYYKHLGFDPENLEDPNRNIFILSKGHNGILLYTIFCDMEMYSLDYLLDTYNTIGNSFGAHPNHKRVKGIEVSTGSLGHGLNWAVGMSHAYREKKVDSRIFVMLGDGEMEEGSNWEAIMYAASKNMDNIVAIVDFNHASASFNCDENIRWGEKGGPQGMANCFAAFGWETYVIDGTNMAEIDKTLENLPKVTHSGKPIAIISSTTKGQGCKFMSERPTAWHIGGLDDEKLAEAQKYIEEYTQEKLKEVK